LRLGGGKVEPVKAKLGYKTSHAHFGPSASFPLNHSQISSALRNFSGRWWRLISEHHKARKSRDQEISTRSRWGLDLTNFFLADVQVGFGSFLAFYLAEQGWSKQDVGIALTVGSVSALLSQLPAGALADRTHWKRALAALGISAILLSALILALQPGYWWVMAAEVLHGVTAGLTVSSISAMSLGLAGRHGISARVGRNFRFAALGNALAAAAMGFAGVYVRSSAIFVAAAVLCVPALLSLWLIHADEIDYVQARNAARKDHSFTRHRIVDLAKNRQLLLFTACLVLFHFSNASLLPLVGQNLGADKSAGSLELMSAMVAAPQIVVAFLAPWVGYWSELWGRKLLLLLAFGCEGARAVSFALFADPSLTFAFQLLDGVTGSIITILTTLVIADITAGSGRFNLTQGTVGMLTASAAALSTTLMGSMVQRLGDTAGFLMLATASLIALVALGLFFQETKPDKYED
jgi:MFS family permease